MREVIKIDEKLCEMLEARHFEELESKDLLLYALGNSTYELSPEALKRLEDRHTRLFKEKQILLDKISELYKPEWATTFSVDFASNSAIFVNDEK